MKIDNPEISVVNNITGTATGLTSGSANALKSATTDVNTSVGAAPTVGQVLTATSGTAATWQTAGGGGGGSPGGSTTQVQYNNAGVFAGSANMTFSGTVLTLANSAVIQGVTVGKGAGAITTNTAVGSGALNANTGGTQNTAFGMDALRDNTSGGNNTAIGKDALYSNIGGVSNTAIGMQVLYRSTGAHYNTAVGQYALFNSTDGAANTAIGYGALQNITTGSGNTSINPLNSGGGPLPVFNPTTQDNRFCMGSTGVTNAYIQVAWTVVSDARDKINFAPVPHGLEFVKALQPTAYQFRTARDSEETNGGVRYGFKAQDVLALEGANPVIVDNEDADKLRMIDTAMIPVLVKAIQELNAKFDAYVLTHP